MSWPKPGSPSPPPPRSAAFWSWSCWRLWWRSEDPVPAPPGKTDMPRGDRYAAAARPASKKSRPNFIALRLGLHVADRLDHFLNVGEAVAGLIELSGLGDHFQDGVGMLRIGDDEDDLLLGLDESAEK